MDMRKEWEKWNIHRASKMEWQPAMDLAWRTFLRYEAGDYTNEGIRSFQEFVSDGRLEQLFLRGSYHLYVATHDGEIVGMITKRDVRHISLLFVDSDYHKMGIGKALITYLAAELRKDDITGMTVNAVMTYIFQKTILGLLNLMELVCMKIKVGTEKNTQVGEQDDLIMAEKKYNVS